VRCHCRRGARQSGLAIRKQCAATEGEKCLQQIAAVHGAPSAVPRHWCPAPKDSTWHALGAADRPAATQNGIAAPTLPPPGTTTLDLPPASLPGLMVRITRLPPEPRAMNGFF
jgi:hypothetical protein